MALSVVILLQSVDYGFGSRWRTIPVGFSLAHDGQGQDGRSKRTKTDSKGSNTRGRGIRGRHDPGIFIGTGTRIIPPPYYRQPSWHEHPQF